MNKGLIILLAIFVAVNSNLSFLDVPQLKETISKHFVSFIKQHNKQYSAKEAAKKFLIFNENLLTMRSDLIFDSNPKFSKFMDISAKEFKKTHRNLKIENINTSDYENFDFSSISDIAVAESLDWRAKGAVTPVKDQGNCGSCWAFSTTGNIEAVNQIKTGELISVSEQQLVDCDTQEDEGCNGGLMENSMKYAQKVGLMAEQDYPYQAVDQKCKYTKSKVAVKISGFTVLTSRKPLDEDIIAKALTANGPLSIAINANYFQAYTGGILDKSAKKCNPLALDHGVLIVGYGSEETNDSPVDYWIVKNSWGADWGENGYIRIAKGKGVCGINTYVVTAN